MIVFRSKGSEDFNDRNVSISILENGGERVVGHIRIRNAVIKGGDVKGTLFDVEFVNSALNDAVCFGFINLSEAKEFARERLESVDKNV